MFIIYTCSQRAQENKRKKRNKNKRAKRITIKLNNVISHLLNPNPSNPFLIYHYNTTTQSKRESQPLKGQTRKS